MPAGVEVIAIAVSEEDNNYIQIWDTAQKKLIRTLKGHTADITCLDWNGKMLTSAGKDGRVILHDIAHDFTIDQFDLTNHEILDLDWDLTGKYLAFGSRLPKHSISDLSIWDIRRLSGSKRNPEERLKRSCLTSFTEKSRHGFNNVAWDRNECSLLAASTGTGLNFYDGHAGFKINTHKSTSDLFKSKYITDILWSKQEQALIVSHSKINSTQTVDDILL